MRVERLLAAAFAGLLLATWSPPSAYGHALVLRSEPGAGVAVATPPRQFALWFSEPVQLETSALAVFDGGGRRVDHLDAHPAADPAEIVATLDDLPSGSYVVRWQVISADNHVVRGTTWFAVGFAVSPPDVATLVGSSPPALPGWEVLGRWLVYVSVLTLVGAPLFTRWVAAPVFLRAATPATRLPDAWGYPGRALLLAAAGLVAGQAIWLMAQLEAVSGSGWPAALVGPTLNVTLFGSRYGLLWWARTLAGTFLALVLLLPTRQRAIGHAIAPVQLTLGLVLLASLSFGSHASGSALPALVGVPVDMLHLAASAVWLGGLLQVFLLLRGTEWPLLRELVPRLSRVGLVSVAILVVTGTVAAWSDVGGLAALLTTAYGQALLVKLGLVVILLVVAAINLLTLRPRFTRAGAAPPRLLGLFGAAVLAELCLAAVVLGSTGLLTALAPPGQQPTPARTEVSRQAGDLRVTLAADPNWVGVSQFVVTLGGPGGAPPADVQSVTLTFAMQGMNMGRTNVSATPTAQGVYAASGYYVGMPGVAEIGVAIQRAAQADLSATFQIEVGTVSQAQLDGLRPTTGLGLPGVFGLALGLVGALCVSLGWRGLGGSMKAPVVAGGIAVLIVGGGTTLAGETLSAATSGSRTANPVPATAAGLARGQDLYTRNCQVCHGATGVGDGPSAAALRPPPADLTLHARWHGDPQLFWFVANGVPGTAMPAFADILSEADRWNVINYLHVLAEAPSATVQAPPGASSSPSPSPSAAASATLATQPGLGRLIYGPDTDHDFSVIDLPDGRPRRVTAFGPLDFASSPAWSADGRQIAYAFYQLPPSARIPLPPGTDLYVMSSDGSGQHPLAMHDLPGAILQNPIWAPDGASVYASYQAARADGSQDIGIDRITLSTGARTRVVANAIAPGLSRNGQLLVYALLPGPSTRSFTLWRSAADGSAAVQLVGPNVFSRFAGPRFSPDEQHIVFAGVGGGQSFNPSGSSWSGLAELFKPALAYADGDLWDIWSVDTDGRNIRRVTAINEDMPTLAWSPDGRGLAFLGGGSTVTAEGGVTLIDLQGQVTVRLTRQPGHRGLDWTPTS